MAREVWLDNRGRHRGRRHNAYLAEYLLGNKPRRWRHNDPRRHYYGGHHHHHYAHHHNPAIGLKTFYRPFPLLQESLAALGGIYVPITLGNFVQSFAAPYLPAALSAPGIMSNLVTVGFRATVAWGMDVYAVRNFLKGGNLNAYRIGNIVGIVGSFVMSLLGRPLIVGPGDTALGPMYAFGALTTTGMTGAGAYIRRWPGAMTGAGAYIRRWPGGFSGRYRESYMGGRYAPSESHARLYGAAPHDRLYGA